MAVPPSPYSYVMLFRMPSVVLSMKTLFAVIDVPPVVIPPLRLPSLVSRPPTPPEPEPRTFLVGF